MQRISHAELILNADGSIYHLNLRPEDIANTIITVGDPGRVGRVSKYFDEVRVKKEKREFVCHTGRIGQREVSVLSTGIGPDNIDIIINELDALVNIDFGTRAPTAEHTALNIIRIGTSGALRSDLPVDSFVGSAYGIGLDNMLSFYQYQPNLPEAELEDELKAFLREKMDLPFYVCAGSNLLLESIGASMYHGITLTAAGFYGPQGRQLRLQPRFNTERMEQLGHFTFRKVPITNFEMETAAIYGLSRMLGHRALSTNVILANRPAGQFSKDPKASVEKLIKHVLEQL
ncbi:nucleoside phosphorylase [Phaeodactylibacter sp.]|uniref:nucleoside phosphorylase n=1 Tax=Phaeodactylibacter sp. TaxID=1940289 RepID=UPI0032EDDC40